MDEEKKPKRRQYTEAHRKATNKYRQERAQIVLVMTKQEREKIQQAAQDTGQSVNKFILEKVLKGL